MNFHHKALCKLRTITTFLVLDKNRENWKKEIQKASEFCLTLANKFANQNYQVQSIRIVTNPFADYLNTTNHETARADLQFIRDLLTSINSDGLRIRFAIGEAKTLHEIALLPALIKEFGDLCNACVNVSIDEHSVLNKTLIDASVQAVKKIATMSERGEGNFNFTVNFNCQPLIPYFPASYHDSKLGNRYVIGLETPDLLLKVLTDFNEKHSEMPLAQKLHRQQALMEQALKYHVSQIAKVIKEFDRTDNQGHFLFSGIDSSAAPSKDCASMVSLYQQLGVPFFGASGTVEASALLTRVFKSISELPLVGFSGLMLAVTEDTGLAKGTINGDYDIRTLLTNSAVCGIGLDTVPIPGDTPASKIAALMSDTGTMAFRLNKPLTVRLFPIPDLKAGELTKFESDDLCNCAVLAVP
ncbi:DUF711 domain-containing protein [Psychromonas sp. psych-6C06]|uniref:DUF711 family protein n=1 Tax=Psychromonas sp. psych-6C06 TaxID=2058089 RepID=UPI000C341BA7|nr:DUF711 family protein [Psychromonas sp. psych-6C06]PKF63632.1 DUF711 domain-containing protein [Psychromonas sp. psych-6C06]